MVNPFNQKKKTPKELFTPSQPAPTSAPPKEAFPLEPVGQNNKVPKWRQELANSRAEQSGLNPADWVDLKTNMTASELAIRKALNEQALNKQIQAEQLNQQPVSQQAIDASRNLGSLNQEQQNKDVVQGEGIVGAGATAGSGVAGLIGGGLAGAGAASAIGAGIGAIGGPVSPLTVPIGAAVGAVAGFTGAVFTKISLSKKQDVKQAYAVYTGTKSNMAYIINQVNQGKLSAVDAANMWDEELANFYSAERNIKQDTDTNLDRFLSQGADEAGKIEAFKRRLPYLQEQLRMAMLKPNPLNIITDTTDVEE